MPAAIKAPCRKPSWRRTLRINRQIRKGLETVVVSASRISIAGYTAPTPVSVIGAEQLQQAANADIGQTLRQLPMMGTAQSPQNGTNGNAGNSGAVGISSINLRNLGVIRTLVLVDGEREVWAGVQYGVDLNTIPSSLIQRVDVVTGGASAAWGSDAVAGVVNLVINKNFTGLKGSDRPAGHQRRPPPPVWLHGHQRLQPSRRQSPCRMGGHL